MHKSSRSVPQNNVPPWSVFGGLKYAITYTRITLITGVELLLLSLKKGWDEDICANGKASPVTKTINHVTPIVLLKIGNKCKDPARIYEE